MKLTAEDICKKYNDAQSIKYTWDSEYRDIFEYCMPSRDGYQKPETRTGTDPNFQDRRDILFSSVGEQSADDFVNTMQEVLCPPYANWIEIEAGSAFPEEEKSDVNKQLDKLSLMANEYKNSSSFDIAFSEFCYDLVAGTSCMLILPGDLRNPLVFKAIPLKEYCIEEGKNSEVRAVYRSYKMKKELVRHQWKELKDKKFKNSTKEEDEKEMELIESTYKDYDTDVWYYCVIDKGNKEKLVEREYKTNPFVVLRWNKCAGEPYGRGVGMKALNDIKTLNLAMNYSLRAFAFNLPPLLVSEDAMIDVDEFELEPFSLNVVPDTQNSIVPMQLQTNHNLESYKLDQLTMQIKRAMYSQTIPDTAIGKATAYEVSERVKELRKNLNSVFGRLLGEFQIPCVQRIFDVLIGFKYISDEFDVTKIDGMIYKVKVNTPLAKQLKHGEAQSIMSSANMLLQFDPSGQALQTMLKTNEAGAHLLDLTGVPAVFINSPQEMEAKQQQNAQAQQQAQQQAVAQDVEASNAKEMGKANARIAETQA